MYIHELETQYVFVSDLLSMSRPPNVCNEVIDQLHIAVGSWASQTTTPLRLATFEEMVKAIYMYLQDVPSDTVKLLLESKCLTEWIWHGDGFTSPEKVALESHFPNSINLHPYLFRLPNELFKVKEFLLFFGVKSQFTVDDLLDMLWGIKAKHDSGTRPSEEVMQDLNQCRAVLEWIVNGDLSEERRFKLLIPVQSSSSKLQLETCNTCTYCDREFLRRGVSEHGIDIKSHLIHKAIPDDLASRLHVPCLSSCLVGAKAVGIKFKEAGQYEPLTTRLRNILREYKKGVAIFKEIIQNADDARASKVCFVVDWRENPRVRLLADDLAKCQGPALWAYNDAMFSDDDFENINKLAGETKKEDLDKVGRFGLGFNSVYHVTDVPSFLSGEHLVVFDPNMNHISQLIDGKKRKGGLMLSLVENRDVLLTFPDQFLPYNQLFGCDMTGSGTFHFQGTLFRLPFRTTEQALESEISKEAYTRDNVNNLIRSLKESAPTLLLFSQNVKEVRVFEIQKNSNPKTSLGRPIISVTKSVDKVLHKNFTEGTILQNSSTWFLNERRSSAQTASEGPRSSELLKMNVSLAKAKLSDVSEVCQKEETWIVNSSTGGKASLQVARSGDGIKNGVVPVTGIAAKMTHSKSHGTKIFPVTGEVFCFMPLSIDSGLPVHVNGSFSVYSNRRRLWEKGVGEHHSSKPFEAKWNEALMEDALVQTYLQLLHILTSYDFKQYKVDFHSLWPNPRKVAYPKAWQPFLRSFFNKIIDEEPSLFYCNGDWRKLKDCFILDPKLNKVAECVDIMKMLGENVLLLPQDFTEAFKSSGKEGFIKNHMLTEDRFLRDVFFPRVTEIPNQLRNSVLVHILDRRLNKHRDYDDLLRAYPCFSCSKDGTFLRKPNELVHPKGKAACLFYEEEQRFPLDDRFLEKERAMMLEELEMAIDFLPWRALIERAKWVSSKCDGSKARLLIQFMNQMPPECIITSAEEEALRAIQFLPILPKPKDYPFAWKSDECHTSLAAADNLYPERHKLLIGSFQLILDESSSVTPNKYLKKILGFASKQPVLSDVIAQLDQIIEPLHPLSEEKKDTLCSTIYELLQKVVPTQQPYLRQQLECRQWILVKGQMVDPKLVAHKWNKEDTSPYLFPLPSWYRTKFKVLFDWYGVKNNFCQEDFIEAILKFKADIGRRKLLEKQIRTLFALLEGLFSLVPNAKFDNLPLPSVDNKLYDAGELVINETPWLETDGRNRVVHEKIPVIWAYNCGAKELRNADLVRCSKPIGQPFGQHENLTDRLKNILKAYSADEGILKELLQNADDAKANEIHFVFDPRTHDSKHIFSDNWKDLQGPAICVYNDKPFSKEDIEGIQKLGIGSKVDDPVKTGQYGIGFNAVYHLTDCPYFISNDEVICVSDPHTAYVPGADEKYPGRLFNQLSKQFRRNYRDVFSGLLGDDIFNLKGSTMFRLPLRRNAKSKISNRQWSDRDVRKLFDVFRTSAKDMLLFLNNVHKISVSEIKDGKLHETYSVMCDVSDTGKRTEFFEKIKAYSQVPTQQIEWQQVQYVMKISDTKNVKKEWFITQSLGHANRESGSQVPNGTEMGLLPRAGIAISMPSTEPPFRHSVFCVLPLPVLTKFPVHINGHFALDSARRGVWHDPNRSDPRAVWNDFMKRHVIAPAYASAICHSRKHIMGYQAQSHTSGIFLSEKETESGLRWYHELFPSITDLDAEWKPVGEALYKNIISLLPVLPVAMSVPEGKKPIAFSQVLPSFLTVTDENEVVPVNVTWCNVNDAFFCTSGLPWSLEKTLLDTGFRLLSHTPGRIHESFKSVELCRDVSPEQVREFLRNKIEIKESLPGEVSNTVFGKVESISKLTKYCAKADDFFQNLEGLPLLLTEDGMLDSFRSGRVVFCSRFSQLLPMRLRLFLHKDLRRHYASDIDKCSGVMREFLISDLAEYQDICFPSSWINTASHQPWVPDEQGKTFPTKEWLVLLWNFIDVVSKKKNDAKSNTENDSETSSILDDIMSWHIFPTTQDCLVPVSMGKTVLNVSTYLNRDSHQDKDMRERLVKLGCPQLKHKILASSSSRSTRSEGATAVRKHYLAMIQSTEDVLGLLNQTLTDRTDAVLKDREIEQLLVFLQSDLTRLSRALLRNLPFYKTISKTYTRLSNASTVYEVPASVPGDDLEVLSTVTSSIFLRHAPKLPDLYRHIGIEQLSDTMFYIGIVLKQFSHLTMQAREIHLEYVRDYLLHENRRNYKSLLSVMKQLPFIPNHSGTLSPANEFYDPGNEVFKKFLSEEKFPPKPFDSNEWKEFLKTIGLKCAVTNDHFLQYAKQLEGEAHNVTDSTSAVAGKILKRANVLVSYLFKNKSLQAPLFLSQISKIRFVPAAKIAELYLDIHPSHTRTILTCFRGSVIEWHVALVWSSASLISCSAVPYCVDDLANKLKLHNNPPPDLVTSHIKNISSRFATTTTIEIPPVLRPILLDVTTKIYSYFKDLCGTNPGSPSNCTPGCTLVSNHLRNVPVVLVDEHTFVRGNQLAFNGVWDEMKPYMFNIPRRLQNLEHFLKCLGAQEYPTPLQCSSVLAEIRRSCVNNEMHAAEIPAAVAATKCLFMRLSQDRRYLGGLGGCILDVAQTLANVATLYLPTEDHHLLPSGEVFVNDIMEKKERLKEYWKQLLIDLNMRDVEPTPKVVELLPSHLSVKKLSSILSEELSPSCKDKTCIVDQDPTSSSCEFIKRYRKIICSREFSDALIRLYKHQDEKAIVSESEIASLRSLEEGVHVSCMRIITVQLVKKPTGDPLPGSESEVPAFVYKSQDAFHILIKHGGERNTGVLHERLSALIFLITGQLIEMACWRYIMMILGVDDPSEISRTLDEAKLPQIISMIPSPDQGRDRPIPGPEPRTIVVPDEDEPANAREAERWMRQAQKDFRTAKYLFRSEEETFYSSTCFHCQQAIEKALKALMFAKGRLKNSDLRVHDVLMLAYRASEIDPRLNPIPGMVTDVQRHYINTRYPTYSRWNALEAIPAEMFGRADAEKALSNAAKILGLLQQTMD